MIRNAELKDTDAILKLLNSADELKGIDSWNYTEGFVKSFVTMPIYFMFVAEQDGMIQGVINGEFRKEQDFVYITDIIVHPEHREKGIASGLMEHLVSFCKENKITQIVSFVKTDNEKMQSFSKKHGFKRGDEFYYYQKDLPK